MQNEPCSSLPAEIRNEIYQYCIVNEENKVVNILHYPNSITRRSVRRASSQANFSQSSWGFTQTYMQVRYRYPTTLYCGITLTSYDQVRKELTPWLRSKRSVRTPLATLNDYVDIFHPRDPVTSKHVGIIEPMCNGKPLPGDGVEILELLREKDGSSDFQLTFTPTPLNLGRTSSDAVDLTLFDELSVFDELNKIRNYGEEFSSIRIMLETRPRQHAEEEGSDDETGKSHLTAFCSIVHLPPTSKITYSRTNRSSS